MEFLNRRTKENRPAHHKDTRLPDAEKLNAFLLNSLCCMSLAVILTGSLYIFPGPKSWTVLAFACFSALSILIISSVFRLKRKYQEGYFLLLLYLSCIVYPAGFFLSGGTVSGIPIIFICVPLCCIFCQRRICRYVSFGASVTVILLLFLSELQNPELPAEIQKRPFQINTILTVFLVIFVLFFSFSRIINGYTALSSARIKSLEYQNQLYQELLESEAERMAFLRRFRHDTRHRNTVLLELLENGNTDKALDYLREFDHEEPSGISRTYCFNLTLNSILNHISRLCRRQEILFSVLADVSEKLPVTSDDLCTIVSNLLENAVNGAANSGSEKPFIAFRAVTNKDRLLLTCENACVPGIRIRNGMLSGCSTGIMSIRTAIESYNGTIEYSSEQACVLRCTILLNLNPDTPHTQNRPERFRKTRAETAVCDFSPLQTRQND